MGRGRREVEGMNGRNDEFKKKKKTDPYKQTEIFGSPSLPSPTLQKVLFSVCLLHACVSSALIKAFSPLLILSAAVWISKRFLRCLLVGALKIFLPFSSGRGTKPDQDPKTESPPCGPSICADF